jgi:iron complex transport system ATP-binding protein
MTDRPCDRPAAPAENAVEHALDARLVEFAYPAGKPVLRGIDLSARAGRLTCLLGPNGSGKTTLLRCLLGQLTPTAGTIVLDARPVAEYKPRQLARLMAYVPQLPTSAFAFTVRQIVLMGRFAHTGMLGIAGRQDRQVADEAMRMTGTLEFAARTLEEISGGEAQQVMIARALAQQPWIVLLDHDWRMAVVCVSHDVNVASRFADELVLMRDGRVIAAGPPADTIRADVLSAAYDVAVELIRAAEGPPFVRAK